MNDTKDQKSNFQRKFVEQGKPCGPMGLYKMRQV